ncbi:hypothetical protein [Staphylococcus hyicus]|uniref:hypothetical protein n=1 Tax=Staphylococcus hyicus TaxID=1284 RepID=UPI003132C16C
MSKKYLIIIGGFIAFCLILGGLALASLMFKGDATPKEEPKQKPEPALTRAKDNEVTFQQEETKKQEEEKKKDKAKKGKDDKPKKVDKKQLEKNTQIVMIKRMEGIKNDNEKSHLESIATSNMVANIEKANSSEDKIVELRNLKLEIKGDPTTKDKEIKGTVVYDQIIKPKNKNSKFKGSTEINLKRAVTFKNEDGQFKVDVLQS